MDKKCPYCQSVVNETVEICSGCNNSLLVECPYCKQIIKAYDEVCPKCSTVLRKRNYEKPLAIIAITLNSLWLLVNIIGLVLLSTFPNVFRLSDGDSEELVFRLGQACIQTLIIVLIPYIIAVVKNFKRAIAISAIIVNVILAIVFVISLLILYVKSA